MANSISEAKPLVYNELRPHEKHFWDVVESLLIQEIKPTPKVVNKELGKAQRTSWSGPLVRIRTQLLNRYGYEGVMSGGGQWRWIKRSEK